MVESSKTLAFDGDASESWSSSFSFSGETSLYSHMHSVQDSSKQVLFPRCLEGDLDLPDFQGKLSMLECHDAQRNQCSPAEGSTLFPLEDRFDAFSWTCSRREHVIGLEERPSWMHPKPMPTLVSRSHDHDDPMSCIDLRGSNVAFHDRSPSIPLCHNSE